MLHAAGPRSQRAIILTDPRIKTNGRLRSSNEMICSQMINAVRCGLTVVLSLLIGIHLGESAPPALTVIAVTDRAALSAASGKEVQVTGLVRHVGVSKSKFFTVIDFEGVATGGFTAVVKSSDLADIERTVGTNLEAGLPGRKVSIRGVISFYKEAPQIEITDALQLKVHP